MSPKPVLKTDGDRFDGGEVLLPRVVTYGLVQRSVFLFLGKTLLRFQDVVRPKVFVEFFFGFWQTNVFVTFVVSQVLDVLILQI